MTGEMKMTDDAIVFGFGYLASPNSKLSFGGDGAEYEITPRARVALDLLLANGFAKKIDPDDQIPNREAYKGAGDLSPHVKSLDISALLGSDWPCFVKKGASHA